MKKIGKFSIVASTVLLGGFMFLGCGGGGGGSSSTNSTSGDSTETVNGTVSDGPIKNARVFIDQNLNGKWDEGEPSGITDENGRYSIEYIPSDDMILMAEDIDGKAIDSKDHKDENLSFFMFNVGNADINPDKMLDYLNQKGLKTYLLSQFNATDLENDTNTTKKFNKLSKGKENKEKLRKIILKILQTKHNFDKNEINSGISNLNLDDAKVSYIQVDKDTNQSDINISEIAQLLPDKTVPNIIPLGNGVAISIAKPLKKATIKSFTEDKSKISLRVAIFPLITSVSGNIDLLLKSTAQNQSQTIFITPYSSILEIPNYHNLLQQGYKPLIGSDVTVKNINGEKITSISDLNATGEIDDNRKGDVNSSKKTDDIYYLYFDISQNKWVESKKITNFEATPDNLYLLPYVIAEKVGTNTTNQIMKDINITISNIKGLKDALVAVKGRYSGDSNSSTRSLKSKVFARGAESPEVILDYIPVKDINNGKANFRIPSNFEVTKIVIVDKNLKEMKTDAVISLDVKDGKADLARGVATILTGPYKEYVLNNIYGSASYIAKVSYKEKQSYNNPSIRRLFIPDWADNNDSLRSSILSMVRNCLVDGDANASKGSNSTLSWGDSYINYKIEWESDSKFGLIKTYTHSSGSYSDEDDDDDDDSKPEIYKYTYIFSPYKVVVDINDEHTTSHTVIENIDKKDNNATVKIKSDYKYNYTDHYNSDYSHSQDNQYLGYFKFDKNSLNLNSLTLNYDFIGKAKHTYDGKIKQFNGLIRVSNGVIKAIKGDYYLKDDSVNTGVKVNIDNDKNVSILLKSANSVFKPLTFTYGYSSITAKNMIDEDINVTNITIGCNFKVKKEDNTTASGESSWDCAKGTHSVKIDGKEQNPSAPQTPDISKCTKVISQGEESILDLSGKLYAENIPSEYTQDESASCTLTYKTSNYGDITYKFTRWH